MLNCKRKRDGDGVRGKGGGEKKEEGGRLGAFEFFEEGAVLEEGEK